MQDKINKYLGQNNLTFSDLGYYAHFLGRNSRLKLGQSVSDPKANWDKLSSGLDTSGGFKHKGEYVQGVHIQETDEMRLGMLYSSLDSLVSNGEDTQSISEMVVKTRDDIYKNTSDPGITKETAPQLKKYFDYALANRDSLTRYTELNSDYAALENTPLSGLNAGSFKSLMALGMTKQDFFGGLFQTATDNLPFDTLSNENRAKMKDYADTTMRLSGLGENLLERGGDKQLKYAMQLKCS